MILSEDLAEDFRGLAKMTEDDRRFLKEEQMMFRSYSNTAKRFLRGYVTIAMVIF